MKSYSLNKEDVFVFENYINQKTDDGIFVELGAVDGIKQSNTCMFEKSLGFSGVLIEPDPQQFQHLKLNRPDSKCFNFAISKIKTQVDMYVSNQPLVSSVVSNTTEAFKNRWHQNSAIITVPAKPLYQILKEGDIQYIDLFSIDVEGCEHEVLETMNWDIPVYIIIIESYHQNWEKCKSILEKQNFKYIRTDRHNDIWINENYFRKNSLYKKIDE
jgi:FkbM family methyltransferase